MKKVNKNLKLFSALIFVFTFLFSCWGTGRNIDNEIKKILKGYNEVGIVSNEDFITTDTIEIINNIDGSLLRIKTNIVCDNIEFEVTIFKDIVTVLPKSEL